MPEHIHNSADFEETEKAQSSIENTQRERASDRTVYLEQEIVREIPKVPRLCDSIEGLEKRYVIVDENCRLYVEEEGAGEPIVLQNGGPGATHHYFHPYFSNLKDSARVIYYDQRGCGLSDRNENERYSIDQACDDLEKLRIALGIEQWTVLGHSYGGLLAQYYSKKYPKSLKGLVLVCANPGLRGLKEGRGEKYLSEEECERMDIINKDTHINERQKLYNYLLNGDWKRQNFFKPSKKEIAREVLYEWDHDPNMRDQIVNEVNSADLDGVFKGCPIPTLIVEGEHDLTWSEDKVEKLRNNHPNADLEMFSESAHSPFKDEPEKFFSLLTHFINQLPQETSKNLPKWIANIANWEEIRKSSPDNLIESLYGNPDCYKIIAESYTALWLKNMKYPSSFNEAGFALYKVERYEDALACFQSMEKRFESDPINLSIALIWQGNMLDLLGRRNSAVSVYRRVKAMDINIEVRHDSLGLSYQPSLYADECMREPFKRFE